MSIQEIQVADYVACWGCWHPLRIGDTAWTETPMDPETCQMVWCRACVRVRLKIQRELRAMSSWPQGMILKDFTSAWARERANIVAVASERDTEKLERREMSEQMTVTDAGVLSERIFSMRSRLKCHDVSHKAEVVVWDLEEHPKSIYFVREGKLFVARHDTRGGPGVPDGYMRYDWREVEAAFVPDPMGRCELSERTHKTSGPLLNALQADMTDIKQRLEALIDYSNTGGKWISDNLKATMDMVHVLLATKAIEADLAACMRNPLNDRMMPPVTEEERESLVAHWRKKLKTLLSPGGTDKTNAPR